MHIFMTGGLVAFWLFACSSLTLAQETGGSEPATASDESGKPEETATEIDLSGLFYLTYESGESDGDEFGDFFVNRAYVTAQAKILRFLSGRVTLDTSQDLEGQGRGEMEVRLKYAFAKFHFGDWGPFRDPNLERVFAAVGYDLGKENILMLDWDSRRFDDPQHPTDHRYQLVLQLKF